MNALELLEKDHHMIKSLMNQLEKSRSRVERKQLFDELSLLIESHIFIEDTEFYPAFRKQSGLESFMSRLYYEHQEITDLLNDAMGSHEEPEFDHRLLELKDALFSHLEEEETQLFKIARESLSSEELSTLGAHLEQSRRKYLEKGRAA